MVDIELFMEVKRIEDVLRKHSCTEALAWCSENKSALRKAKVRELLLLIALDDADEVDALSEHTRI